MDKFREAVDTRQYGYAAKYVTKELRGHAGAIRGRRGGFGSRDRRHSGLFQEQGNSSPDKVKFLFCTCSIRSRKTSSRAKSAGGKEEARPSRHLSPGGAEYHDEPREARCKKWATWTRKHVPVRAGAAADLRESDRNRQGRRGMEAEHPDQPGHGSTRRPISTTTGRRTTRAWTNFKGSMINNRFTRQPPSTAQVVEKLPQTPRSRDRLPDDIAPFTAPPSQPATENILNAFW